MKKAFCALFCMWSVLLGNEACGAISSGNHRLDRAIYARHDPKLIISGRIVGKEPVVSFEDAGVGFKFKVATVVLGQPSLQGQTLAIPASGFRWPTGLLDFQEGEPCVLVLRTDWGEKRDGYFLESVVPVRSAELKTAKDGEEAKSLLALELLGKLKQEPSTNRQRHLILQVAPILNKADSDALIPFLKSDDIWLRRAALAGLIVATKGTNYLAMASDDIEQFIKTTDPTGAIPSLDEDAGCSPYRLLFSHYFFLAVAWGREDYAAAGAYLPLFRQVAHSKPVPEWFRWDHGVAPLCQVGTREDARFLYEYCSDTEGMDKAEVLRFASHRQRILMAISENLRLPIWVEADFLSKEHEQHEQISNALVKEGIITADQVHRHPQTLGVGDRKPTP